MKFLDGQLREINFKIAISSLTGWCWISNYNVVNF
ncbi:hypothetical protein T08_1781 [Trichinella sp. T8]|nr:hypothetical protein T08_1781 [Trichinella sp. T8]